ncbi:NHL repeat-containing protein [bacterium]|nr:NHL repeat-containing protein [bacterium]
MKKTLLLISIISLLATGYLFAESDESTLLIPPFKHTWGVHKGTRAKLKMLLGMDKDFEDPQGLAIVKLKATDDPNIKEDNDEVTAYGVNARRGEVIYNKDMYHLGIFGKDCGDDGELSNPHGITANPEGDVYIADTDNQRIVKLFNPGGELSYVKSFGQAELGTPFDVCISPCNRLFVTDNENNCVFVYDTSGQIMDTIGQGILLAPRGIHVSSEKEPWGYYRKNFVVVTDSLGKRLVKLDFDGNLLNSINYRQMGLEEADFQYLALDYYDNVYLTDKLNCQVHKFDPELNFLTSFGRCGEKDNEFTEPRGIAIWRRFGQIIIAESKSAQYYWVGIFVPRFRAQYIPEDNQIRLDYFVTEKAYLTLNIYDSKGKLAGTLVNKRRREIGENLDFFKVRDNKKKLLPPGEYTLEAIFSATYSSYTHFEKTFTQKFKIPS